MKRNEIRESLKIIQRKKGKAAKKDICVSNNKNQNNVIDLDFYDDSHIVVRTFEEIEEQLLRKVLFEIETFHTHLSNDSMMYIAKIIENNRSWFKFQDTIILINNFERIQHVQNNDDIQFLFEPGPTVDSIGHWICINFKHYIKKVRIYDSLYNQRLIPLHQKTIECLYPTIDLEQDVEFVQIINKQNDSTSCGVYAAVYAITLALNRDPSILNFKICYSSNEDESKFLRQHLSKIIREKRLLSFPEQ